MFALLLTIKLTTVQLGSFETRQKCMEAGIRIERAIQYNTHKHHPDVSYMCIEQKYKQNKK